MKTQHNFTIVIITIVLSINNFVFIQNITAQSRKNKISLNYNPNNKKKYIKTIDFINPITKDTVITFDVHTHNPYDNINFTLLDNTNSQDYKQYKINNITKKDFKLSEARFGFRKDLPDTALISDGFATSYSGVFFSDTTYIIVLYKFILYQGGSFLGMSTTILILSNEGQIIHKLNDFSTECYSPSITKDGKYFAYGFGGGNDEEGNTLDSVGYAIIDLKSEKIIIYENIDKDYYSALPYSYGNLIRINCKKNKYRKYIVYDFDENKKYSKTYDIRQIPFLKKITKYGFVFEEGESSSNQYRTDYYNKVFEQEDIK